jgi:hypothetical protein
MNGVTEKKLLASAATKWQHQSPNSSPKKSDRIHLMILREVKHVLHRHFFFQQIDGCEGDHLNIRVNMAPSCIKFLDVQFPILTKINITLQVFTVVTVHDVVVWVV